MGILALVATVGISAFIATIDNPRPSAPSPAEPPITITSGGTYSGNWTSTSSTPAVRIRTTELVVIQDSIITNLADGALVVTDWPLAANVTLRRVKAFGGSGRFFEAEGFKSIRIENCTIAKTSGIELVRGAAGSSVVITKNKQRNIQGPTQGASGLAQFVQLIEVQTAAIDVSWNQIINEFGKSEVEDVISIFKSAHGRIHDNYIQGGYPLTNTTGSSASGITIESGDLGAFTSFDNEIWNNTVVDSVGGIGIVGGYDNSAHHNHVVQDGKLGDGSTLLAANLGMAIWNINNDSSWANNHAYDNIVGYVHARGHRNDMWFPDAPGDYARNTSRRGRVTRAIERAAWRTWLAKLGAKRTRLGA